MATVDGRDYIRHHDRLADTCVSCDARGVTIRGGSLRCVGHAHLFAIATFRQGDTPSVDPELWAALVQACPRVRTSYAWGPQS